MIDPTATRLRIEELTCLAKKRVALAPQHSFLFPHLCVSHSGHFFSNTEVLRETTNITRRYLNTVVHRTAERGTIIAVVVNFWFSGRNCSHDPWFSYRRFDFLYSDNSSFINCSRFS